MTDMLQEFCDSRGASMRVNAQAGVIRGVKLLGLESRNGRTYLPETLAQAARLYEEAKVNVNHPKGNPAGPRDYQDRIGTIRGVAMRPGEGLFGDFHFNPKHALAEQLVWDAEHAPENVGFSHNVEARTSRRGDRVVVETILRVQSVDLVADPATTRGLFESAGVARGGQSEGDSPIFADHGFAAVPAKIGTVPEPAKPLSLDDLKRDYPELIESIGREQAAEVGRLRVSLRMSERLVQPQSPPLLRRVSWLNCRASSAKESPEWNFASTVCGLAFELGVGLAVGARELDHPQQGGILLVKAILVLLVVGFDFDRADKALRLPLLLDHVVVDDVLLLLLAVLPQGHAARAEIGEKLGPVAVELADLDLRNLIIDGAGGDLALVLLVAVLGFVEFFDDQDLVDAVLDDVVLQRLELLIEFLLIPGALLQGRDKRCDIPADVIDRDDPVLDDRGDAVGKSQVQAVIDPRPTTTPSLGRGEKGRRQRSAIG